MKRRLPMIARLAIGVLVGGLMGYGVYRFVGCSSGACPMTSNPWVSTIFGMVIGGLLAGDVR
jgi:high-affinity Fe2+/Pb2+ permease